MSIMALLMLIATISFAQTTITGKITDSESGIPLIGANVLIQNSYSGTTTDLDGNYTLEVENGDVLVFSYIGYLSQEITYNGQSKIDVSLFQ